MKMWKTVAIVGVGLIGGSIGRALQRKKLAQRVVGVGRHENKLRRAQRLGIVTDFSVCVEDGVREADLVVVCTPVASIVEHVRRVASACSPKSLITDVGSTKSAICSALTARRLPGATFVGSHPLAGSEKTGFDNAREDLLEGRLVIVTPQASTPPTAVRQIKQFWRQLGAEVHQMSPVAHDRTLAATSHLPHLMASVLAASTPAQVLPYVATGWLDTTRIAAGDVQLWEQIVMQNRGHMLKSLEKFEKVLDSLRHALESDNPRPLRTILTKGKQQRDSVGN
ncbi:MAG: prephenate dehydrogenase [Pirellulaceae bacterium]|nr:prephenate dehydrogenase [Pirellulaceae bacterium]